MKTPLLPLAIVLLAAASTASAAPVEPKVADVLAPLPAGAVKLGGTLGEAIDLCHTKRVAAQNVEDLLVPFRERKDVTEWRSEFWGKWITSAILDYRRSGDPALRTKIEQAVAGLLATQSPDGYMGAYAETNRLQRWDVWGRKYTLLGLLAWHGVSGDAAVLAAARRLADGLMAEFGPANPAPFKNDMWTGMASSSVIEPLVLLHRRTGDARYLEHAQWIVSRWDAPDGPNLLNKALKGTPVFAMFPGPKAEIKGYMDVGTSKAYEMMSCFEGLLELYRVTGNADLLRAVRGIHANIRDTEITVIGSGSDWERWCDGRRRQTEPWQKGMETCVTVTWIKLCGQLLRLTGDAALADEIEIAAYNALLGALPPAGDWWVHHAPLAGVKERAPEQCGMHQNCCVASGPRGLMLLPQLAVMSRADGPVVNLYAPMRAEAPLPDGNRVTLDMETEYPRANEILVKVSPARRAAFTLSLRIPAWSRQHHLEVNGEPVESVKPGAYVTISRMWVRGDTVKLQLDLRGRVVTDPGPGTHLAVLRGPVVLARDRRLDEDIDHRVAFDLGDEDVIPLSPEGSANGMRSVYRTVLRAGVGAIALCDFASAGNTLDSNSTYRVWMPRAR